MTGLIFFGLEASASANNNGAWHSSVLALEAAAHQAPGVEVEVEDVVELPPAGGLEVEYAEVAVALEVARDKDNDVKPAATLVRRQTEVSLMVLSLFCYVTIVRVTKNFQEKAGRSVLRKATSAVV